MGAARKLITLDEAIDLINKHYGYDPEKHGKGVYTKKTIYNMVHKGKLGRHGPRHMLQLDEDEVILKLCR